MNLVKQAMSSLSIHFVILQPLVKSLLSLGLFRLKKSIYFIFSLHRGSFQALFSGPIPVHSLLSGNQNHLQYLTCREKQIYNHHSRMMSFTPVLTQEECPFILTTATQNMRLHNKDNTISSYPKKPVLEVYICSEQKKNLIGFSILDL